jgi:hypothetical protein
MASGKSNTLKNAILDHVLGGPDYVRVSPLYLALYTVAPTAAGGGTEVTGGAYARVSITNNATNFPAASGGSKSNGAIVTFPTATADWGTVVAAALHTHITNDTPVYWGTLSANRSVPNGAIADFPVGTLTFTET